MTEESKQALTFYRIDDRSYCRLQKNVLVRYLTEVKRSVLQPAKFLLLTVFGTALLWAMDALNPILYLKTVLSEDLLMFAGIALLGLLGILLVNTSAPELFQSNQVNPMDGALIVLFSVDVLYLLCSVFSGWNGFSGGDWRIAYLVMVFCFSVVLLFCRIALYGTGSQKESEE